MPDVELSPAKPPTLTALMIELLTWIAARPRTYGEAMQAWRTSCPRSPIWEDATSDGFVEVVPGNGAGLEDYAVRLTPSGRDALAAATGSVS